MSVVEKRFSIAIDIKSYIPNTDFEVVENDNGNVIDVSLTDDGKPIDLTGCKVVVVFAKPNGTTAQQDNDEGNGVKVLEDNVNEIEIELFTTSFSPGVVNAEIQVYSGENFGVLVTSALFNFKCRRGIANEETVQSTKEWPLLTGLIRRVEGMEDELNELVPQAEETIDRSNAAAEQAQEAAQSADEKADDAATAAQAATEAAGKANAAADTAEAAGREAAQVANAAAAQAVGIAEEAAANAQQTAGEAAGKANAAADRASGVLDDAETATAAANEAAGEANEAANAANSAAATATTAAGNASAAAQAANTAAGRANDVLDDAQQAANAANTAAGRANTAAGEAETAADRANAAAEAAEDIVGGALPKHAQTHAKGATDEITLDMLGAADAQTVDQLKIDIANKADKTISTAITLLADGWTGDGPYTQAVSVAHLTGSRFENPDVFPEFTDEIEAEREAWNLVDQVVSVEGALEFTCLTEAPEMDLTLIVKVRD